MPHSCPHLHLSVPAVVRLPSARAWSFTLGRGLAFVAMTDSLLCPDCGEEVPLPVSPASPYTVGGQVREVAVCPGCAVLLTRPAGGSESPWTAP